MERGRDQSGEGADPEDGDLDRLEPLEEVEEVDAACPYCGEPVTVSADPGGGRRQQYVEDCPVCCRPWSVHVRFSDGGARVELDATD